MSRPAGDLPFVDHLEELRRRLLLVLACLLAAWIPAFLLIDRVLPFLLVPLGESAARLVYLRPAEKFMAYLSLGFDLALLAAIPVLLLQLALFVRPALTGSLRRSLIPFLLGDLLLLGGGLCFAWFVLVPFAIGFFISFGRQDGIQAFWSLGEYVSLVSVLLMATTLVFQLPIVLLFAFRSGLVRVRAVARVRRYAILIIFIVAAVITPPDIVSQFLTAIPLVLLFELTLLVGRLIEKRPSPEPSGSGDTAAVDQLAP